MTNQGPRKAVELTHWSARLQQGCEFHGSARSLITHGSSANCSVARMKSTAVREA